MNLITLPKSVHREGRKGREEQLYESLLHSSAFQVLSFVLIRVYPRRSAVKPVLIFSVSPCLRGEILFPITRDSGDLPVVSFSRGKKDLLAALHRPGPDHGRGPASVVGPGAHLAA